MKKILKIAAIIIGCLFLLMVILSFALEGKVDEIIKSEGNKMLTAKFDYKDLDISFFKNFPRLSVTIKGLTIEGTGEFENETLINAGDITAAVNIMSVFGDGGYEISKVLLENIWINAVKLPDGKVNWDILKSCGAEEPAAPEPEEKGPETAETEAKPLKILLKSIVLKNINVTYDDRADNIYADIKDFGAVCSGNLGSDKTAVDLETAVKSATISLNGTSFLKDASLSAKIGMDADLVNKKFTLTKSGLRLNSININIDGWVAIPEKGADMDIKIATNDIGIKDLLSLIPAGYVKDLDKIKTGGSVAVSVSAKGTLEGDNLPAFDAVIKVKDGDFRYPEPPASVNNINIDASATSPGGPLDKISASLSDLRFNLAGNPFAITASIKTPISDPDFTASARGVIALDKIKDVYPLDNITVSGLLNADITAAGRLSYAEKKLYDKFDVKGVLQLENATVTLNGVPEIKVKKSVFSFTPKYLSLDTEKVNVGENDISAKGRIENYIGFALKGETIKGSLNISSNYFNLNDFIKMPKTVNEGQTPDKAEKPESAAQKEQARQPSENGAEGKSAVIEVPKNIDFIMNTDMKKIIFGNMALDNLKGRLIIKNGEIDMENISFDTMGGFIGLNGLYSTKANPETPEVKAGLNIKNISFSEAYNGLGIVRSLAPIFANIKGSFSGDIILDTRLDETMAPIPGTVNGKGSVSAKNLSINEVKVIDDIADILKKDELKNIKTKDINVSFSIKNGRVTTKPFDIKSGDTVIRLSGSTGLDRTIDYSGKITLPPSAAEKTKLTSLDLKIGGTFSSPEVSVDTRSMINQTIDAVKDKAAEELKKHGVDLDKAAEQKDKLIEAARKAGDRLVDEAKKQVEKLKEKAGNNPIQKFAAEKTGDALVEEAKKQAEKLIDDASREGDKIIEKVKKGL